VIRGFFAEKKTLPRVQLKKAPAREAGGATEHNSREDSSSTHSITGKNSRVTHTAQQ